MTCSRKLDEVDRAATTMTDVASVEDLVGVELSGVSLVRDYVELLFDGPVLRSLAPLVLKEAGNAKSLDDEGALEGLRALIGSKVTSVRDDPAALSLEFSTGATVEIPRKIRDVGAEVAHFVPFVDGVPDLAGMFVWESLPST